SRRATSSSRTRTATARWLTSATATPSKRSTRRRSSKRGSRMTFPRSVAVSGALLGGALVAWIVTYQRMHGMDAGPGTDLGGLGWYVGIWVTMMAAMMLPSAAPMVLLFARVAAERRRRGQDVVSTPIFVAGYIGAWTLYGLGAYGLYRAATAAGTGFLAWDRAGPYIVGVAVAAAGIYELTPLKSVCLRHCRT